MRFPIVKLLNYRGREDQLEASANPFALVVLAHLQSQATRQNQDERRVWKVRLIKGLLDRGLVAEDIRQLFRVIDWLLELPDELESKFWQEIQEYEKEKKMPVFTSTERWLINKGKEEGGREHLLTVIAAGLRGRFGDKGSALLPEIENITDLGHLQSLAGVLYTINTIEELHSLLPVATDEID